MNILILGGNSPRHQQWVRDMAAALAPHYDEVRALDYRHWQTGETLADIDHEITAAGELVHDWDDYVVVAKSVGTVIATLAHARGALHASRYLLLGIPYDGIAGQTPEFDSALQTLTSLAVVQNQFDPYGSADMVRQRLDALGLASLELVEVPAVTTHDYTDTAQMRELLEH